MRLMTGSPSRSSLPWNDGSACAPTFPTVASRWCGTMDFATLSEPTVQMVIFTSSPNRKLLVSRYRSCQAEAGL